MAKIYGNTVATTIDVDKIGSGGGVSSEELDKKADKATTLEGYGITDAYTKEEVNAKISTGGGSITIDQNYNPTSENAQSGTAVAEAISEKSDKMDLDSLYYYGDKDVIPTESSSFEIDPFTGKVVGYWGNEANVVVPYEIDGAKVLHIGGQLFYNKYNITSVLIPNTVTSIETYAFGNCGLTNFTIPNSVINIDSYAFSGCSFLTSIAIPDSVTSIGSYAFNGCIDLTNIIIPNSVTDIGEGAFSSCDNVTVICNSGSYAETYCKVNNINYVLDTVSPDDLGGSVDLGNYYTRAETDEINENKVDKVDGFGLVKLEYPDDEEIVRISIAEGDMVRITDFYYKEQVDDKLEDKADKSNTYTKEEIDSMITNSGGGTIDQDAIDALDRVLEMQEGGTITE